MTLRAYESATAATRDLDPITLEVQWSRLISIADEADNTLVRTAFSTIVGEARDFAVIMLDEDGRSIAQSNFSSPAFTVTLPRTCKTFLEVFGRENMRPGDVYITNDPWLASGHLPDCSLVMPVFYRDRVIGFMATAAHMADIGGTPGSRRAICSKRVCVSRRPDCGRLESRTRRHSTSSVRTSASRTWWSATWAPSVRRSSWVPVAWWNSSRTTALTTWSRSQSTS
jgi:hypothetical protein